MASATTYFPNSTETIAKNIKNLSQKNLPEKVFAIVFL